MKRDSNTEIIPLTPEQKAIFQEIWVSNYRFVQARIRSYHVSEDDREDVASSCFLKLYSRAELLEAMTAEEIRRYISVTVRNECTMWHIRQNRLLKVPLDEDTIEVLIKNSARDTEDALIARMEDHSTAVQLMQGLSERDRFLLVGRYVVGYTDEELAAYIGCQPQSVRSMLSRARKNAYAFQKQLEKEGDKND